VEKTTFDVSAWPVLLVKVPPSPVSTAQFRERLDTISSFYERGRLGLVIDVRGAGTITAAERRLLAERFDDDVARFPDRVACVGIVLESSVQRGILKAVSWLTSSPFEREAFSDVDTAKKWAHDWAIAVPLSRREAR
jgi:hypothetical protein